MTEAKFKQAVQSSGPGRCCAITGHEDQVHV